MKKNERENPEAQQYSEQTDISASDEQDAFEVQQENETEEPRIFSLIALRDVVVFPYMVTHFDVGRTKSRHALESAMSEDQIIVVTAQKDSELEDPAADDLYEIGTLAKVKQILRLSGNSVRVLAEGLCRARLQKIIDSPTQFRTTIEVVRDRDGLMEDEKVNGALLRRLRKAFESYFSTNNKLSTDSMASIMAIDNVAHLSDVIVANIDMSFADKQALLETIPVIDRVTKLISILESEMEIVRLEETISKKVRESIDRTQRDYYLREQLKVIYDELGDKDSIAGEVRMYREKMDSLKLSAEVREKLTRELDKLQKMPMGSPEGTGVRNYLDTMLSLPWNKKTRERYDLEKAQKILDRDHYGLEKVKERVIEYLAVRKLSRAATSPILCLVGPPGVGKTSIAKSIAEAINRSYVRLSLGGVRDEADIRGHRRTYIGSMPGRIINAMQLAKSQNPLMLMDEIDKMGNDFHGDPASALLEVLDSEQNYAFRDHYLEVPFDLSSVLFVTTANTLDTIPPALLDRMEVIEISGYTMEEKQHIAKQFLLPKQMKRCGLKEGQLEITDDALEDIINFYTREAGVRNLERELGHICRKTAKQLVSSRRRIITVTPINLPTFLGIARYRYDMANQKDDIGIVRGLAWTSAGGDTLSIEVNVMPGSGHIELTGNMGDVMKESARTAISYIRSRTDKLGIETDFYKLLDIHIHVPEGAVPKDGPSAGIAMATALASALSGYPVRANVAMTGEITLRGRVLAIGGLKEKTLAAFRAGITTVILPKENERDLQEIPEKVREALSFVLVEDMDEVLSHALTSRKQRGFKLPLAGQALAAIPQDTTAAHTSLRQ